MTPEQIEQNRKIAIAALKSNHRGYRQIHSSLTDDCDGRCADGLIMEALHIKIDCRGYGELRLALGDQPNVSDSVSLIYDWNDCDKLSFSEIACKLREYWGL